MHKCEICGNLYCSESHDCGLCFNCELSKKDEKIKYLEQRVKELEDRDWYEDIIKQLEEQNDRLIKERDALTAKLEHIAKKDTSNDF